MKKNDTPWFVIILLICPSKRPSEQLCTGHQKARERGGDQEHHGKTVDSEHEAMQQPL